MGIFVNKYGNIGTTALEAATNGLAAMSQVDSKTLDQTLKLFGGFERNTFEQVTAQTTQTQPSIQQAADYPRPAQLLKEYTEYDSKGSMGAYGEVVKNLNDPRFNVSDGLASFSRNGIGNVLNSLEEKGIIIVGGKPDNTSTTQQKVNAGAEPLMYIYPERHMQPAAKGLEPVPEDGKTFAPVPEDGKTSGMMSPIPEDGKAAIPVPDDGKTFEPVPEDGKTSGMMVPIPEDGKAAIPVPNDGKAQPIPEDGKTATPVPEDGKTFGPIPDDGKTLRSGGIEQNVLIDEGKKIAVGDLNNVLNGQIPAETRTAFVQDILLKLQKMQDTTMQQLKLYQDLKFSKGIGFEY